MTTGTPLLNDDGTASMATAVLLSHYAFRRDITRFAAALAAVLGGDHSRVDALREEWRNYRGALHGHHTIEDTQMFPGLRNAHPELGSTLDRLGAQHRLIDPLLERADAAFEAMPDAAGAAARVVTEIAAVLGEHLADEEAHVSQYFRGAKEFPPPPTEADAELYAQGFAWSTFGVAPDVLVPLDALLPKILSSKLPEARAAFGVRWERVWGPVTPVPSRTSIPAS